MLDAERLAMSMAVLTQLHVSLAQFAHARREYETAGRYQGTQREIIGQVRSGVKAGSVNEQALIREEMIDRGGASRRGLRRRRECLRRCRRVNGNRPTPGRGGRRAVRRSACQDAASALGEP